MSDRQFSVRLLSAGPFVTMVDRFSVAPLLIPIASDLHVPLAVATFAATAYFFVYGIAQPFWGLLSDRVGRIRVIRLSLGATAVGCTLSALAPNIGFLIAARVFDGIAVCAILPTAIVYVGDMVPFERRHASVADVLAAVALGTAVGSVGAGLFAHFLTWRLAFALPAVLAATLAVTMSRLPESAVRNSAVGPLEQLRLAMRPPWARFLILFAVPEGAVVLGFLVYLAPALESAGTNTAVAGLVVATYGAAVMAGTLVVKRIASRVPAWVPIGIGGSMAVAGYLVAALDQHTFAILFASVMIGGCYSIFHSTLQAWSTDVAPDVRGTAGALFVTGAWTGGAISSGVGGAYAQAHLYGALFLLAAAITVPVVVTAAFARARYPGSTLPSSPGLAAS